eukprot:scaffold83187_cov33-Phaeocystis_antarctica.AAC.1
MSYTQIKAKLKESEYGDDHLAFASDVRLVFANALKYNYDRENQCHIAACTNMRFFESTFGRAQNPNAGPALGGSSGGSGGPRGG